SVEYSDDDMEVKISNFFGLGKEIGRAKLTSHETPTEVRNVIEGENRTVMYYEFNFKEKYDNGLGKVEFINMHSGEKIEKDYYFAIAVYDEDGILSHWERLDEGNIPKGKVTIGLVTDVNTGDYIDGIWTVAGKKIKKHATWSASLNNGLVHYWNCDEGTGTDVGDQRGGDTGVQRNGTIVTGGGWDDGIINGGCTGNGVTDEGGFEMDGYLNGDLGNDTFTISFWINETSDTDQSQGYFGGAVDTQNRYMVNTVAGGTAVWVIDGAGASIIRGRPDSLHTWHYMAIISNATGTYAYIDSVLEGSDLTGRTPTDVWKTLRIGGVNASGYKSMNGTIDEIGIWNRTLTDSEISNIWNSGAGISYTMDFDKNPTVTLNKPLNNTNISTQTIDFNCNATDDFMVENVSLYFDGTLNHTVEDGVTNETELAISLNVSDGSYIWTCQAYDNSTIPQLTIAGERNFTLDRHPPNINISFPFEAVDYQISNHNLTINYSVTDDLLEGCVGSFDNGVNNITLVCADGNYTVNISSINNNTFNIFANDSSGKEANLSRTWDYKVFQREVNFSSSTIEGSTEQFYLNFEQGAGLQTSLVKFVYNITETSAAFIVVDNNVTVLDSFGIPQQDEDSTVVPFYWSITMSDGSVVNTTIYNHTVGTFEVDNCTDFSTVLYNYTVLDEKEQTILANTTIEIQFSMFDSGRTENILNFSHKYEEVNPAQICINGSLSNTAGYSVTTVVKYTSNDSGNPYAEEYYNILNGSLTNASIPININLYDLKSIDSTEFQLTFRDSSLTLAPNILVFLYRQYVSDNDFKVVEIPLTDTNGQTILHLVRNDVVYNILFVEESGRVLATYNKMIAFCQDFTIGQCTLELNAVSDTDTIYDYSDDLGVSYTNPRYSNLTGVISFDFLSTDLSVKTVRTEVVRNNQFGNRTVCTNSLTSTSGTVTCDVSEIVDSDRFLFTYIYVDGDLKTQSTIDLEQSETGSFGLVNGALFAFLLMIFIISIFAHDKQALMVALVFGWAAVVALGAINGALIGGISGGMWLIVTAVFIIMRLKKEEVG
ncbi:hypothetical protein LCGC14_1415780, partial [marine sediment metagenome]